MLNASQPIATRTLTANELKVKVSIFKDAEYLRAVVIPVNDAEIETILDAVQLNASEERALDFFRVEAKRDLRFKQEYRKADDETKSALVDELAYAKMAKAELNKFVPINLLEDEQGQRWLFHEAFSCDTRYQRELGCTANAPALIFTACDETGHVIIAK